MFGAESPVRVWVREEDGEGTIVKIQIQERGGESPKSRGERNPRVGASESTRLRGNPAGASRVPPRSARKSRAKSRVD